MILENTDNPLKTDSGNTTSCMEIVADITERKRAEEYLQESRDRDKGALQDLGGAPDHHGPREWIIQVMSLRLRRSAMKKKNRKQMLGKTADRCVYSNPVRR